MGYLFFSDNHFLGVLLLPDWQCGRLFGFWIQICEFFRLYGFLHSSGVR
jgi:hypothetical protein